MNSFLRICPLIACLCLLQACLADWRFECESSLDCLAGDFCQMGRCVDLSPTGSTAHRPPPLTSDNQLHHDAGLSSDVLEEDHEEEPHPCPDASPPTSQSLILNEVFANVPTGPEGDANGDGLRDAADDEFVELVNLSENTLDLTGLAITNAGDPRFTFPPTCLEPNHAVVVFGGISPGATTPAGEGWTSFIAHRRFSFANGGGQVTITDATGQLLTELTYGSHPAQSLTRSPELTGQLFVPHRELHDGAIFSPGTCADGRPFTTGCTASHPPPDE